MGKCYIFSYTVRQHLSKLILQPTNLFQMLIIKLFILKFQKTKDDDFVDDSSSDDNEVGEDGELKPKEKKDKKRFVPHIRHNIFYCVYEQQTSQRTWCTQLCLLHIQSLDEDEAGVSISF